LRQAARDRQSWLDRGLAAPPIAVNVSAVQLHKADFVHTVLAALGTPAALAGIDLEITESAAMEDVDNTIAKLLLLREHGIALAVDDFGTGYSSLAYLSKLPVQVLKIDRAFTMRMNEDPNTMTLVATMISLAHAMRMEVVAEGVETEDQAEALQRLMCDQLQGYLISRPVPEPVMALMLLPALAA
jgi:EAL domain-containing protein (putative c-di-GMP-specific phosphodiesterase class I)